MSKFKIPAKTNIVVAIIFAILGLLIAFKPNAIMNIIITILGLIFIGYGIVMLINYAKSKGKFDFTDVNLLPAIGSIIIGLVILIFGKTIIAIFRIAIGIWIIFSSILKFQFSSQLRKMGITSWKFMMAFAGIMLLCGLIVTFNSGAITSTLGILILTYSVIDIIENIMVMKNTKVIYKK